jgi:serine/threonine protein kinase
MAHGETSFHPRADPASHPLPIDPRIQIDSMWSTARAVEPGAGTPLPIDEEIDLPKPFGNYTLLRRLAVGGMAEVYVGKTKGIGGFEKLVAIKVIHPRYSEDEHFVTMLVEEAKISVLLNHVNIAQTFDLSCIDGTYYIVMEFIEGADAYRVMRKAAEIKRALPIDICAFIAAEVCLGLDYAHRKRDSEGRPLGIVHRDISPQNILISYAGEVKIIDFGIAKAAARSTQTEAGVIKGKYYYMSPEQAWGDPVDHRSDIFSTGVVLYELLTGRGLYTEDNVPLLLDKVRKAEIAPPETRRPSVPKELSQIVMKALARDPDKRFQSAQEMSQALTSFLYATNPTFTAGHLADLMGTLFPEEVQRHSAMVKLPPLEEPLAPEDAEKAADTNSSASHPLFDLADEDDEADATRNDILPFRRKLAAQRAENAAERDAQAQGAERVTKPAAGVEKRAEAGRPTFRPPRLQLTQPAVFDDTTAKKLPSPDVLAQAAGSDTITAPRVGPGGSWVSPVQAFDDMTTNPRRVPDEPTDDTHAAAEWDEPTKLKGDGAWEDENQDHTLVDPSNLARAVDALRAAHEATSERGKVNVSWAVQRAPARHGKGDRHPIPQAADVPKAAPSRASGKPDPRPRSATPAPVVMPAPAAVGVAPAVIGGPAPGSSQGPVAPVPAPVPRPTAGPDAFPTSQPTAPYPLQPGEAPPQPWPAPAATVSSAWPAPAGSFSSAGPVAPGLSAASFSPAGPVAPGPSAASFSPAGPVAAGPVPAASSDPFGPPPPHPSAQITGGFKVLEPEGRKTLLGVVAWVLGIAIAVGLAIAVTFGRGPPPAFEIISSPTGAQVTIDGQRIPGVTPILYRQGLEEGRSYVIEVSLPGYQPSTRTLTASSGTQRQFFVLIAIPAQLRVETDPPGVDVVVNGASRGSSPVEVTGLAAGQEVEVRAQFPGRGVVIRRVQLGSGTTVERISSP